MPDDHELFRRFYFEIDPKLCFVLMPLAEEFQPVYEDHIKTTIERAGLRCVRADELVSPRSITQDAWEYICKARVLIADLTGKNPNVLYEVGLAHALNKKVILITQSMDDVPFHLRYLRCIVYSYTPRGMFALEERLLEAIEEVLQEPVVAAIEGDVEGLRQRLREMEGRFQEPRTIPPSWLLWGLGIGMLLVIAVLLVSMNPLLSPMPATTPQPNYTSAVPTSTPTEIAAPTLVCVFEAAFVVDVTAPEDAIFRPGEEFEKALRLRSSGTCPWDKGYERAHISDEQVTVIIVMQTAPGIGSTKINPIDGAEMVYVPARWFTMGSDDSDPGAYDREKPQHTLRLDTFWIYRTEVTNAQYRKCVKAGACTPPRDTKYYDDSAYAAHPVVYVDWYQAKAYSEWAGGRLPTEAEWEKAARGTDGRIYPWGNDWDPSKLNSYEAGPGHTTEVGSYQVGASPYGVLDMAGNVSEWTSSLYKEYPYNPRDGREESGSEGLRVLRGGSIYNEKRSIRCAFRGGDYPDHSDYSFGFRVVLSPSNFE